MSEGCCGRRKFLQWGAAKTGKVAAANVASRIITPAALLTGLAKLAACAHSSGSKPPPICSSGIAELDGEGRRLFYLGTHEEMARNVAGTRFAVIEYQIHHNTPVDIAAFEIAKNVLEARIHPSIQYRLFPIDGCFTEEPMDAHDLIAVGDQLYVDVEPQDAYPVVAIVAKEFYENPNFRGVSLRPGLQWFGGRFNGLSTIEKAAVKVHEAGHDIGVPDPDHWRTVDRHCTIPRCAMNSPTGNLYFCGYCQQEIADYGGKPADPNAHII